MQTLTNAEFDFLAQFEENYACAIEGRYLKGAPLSDLQEMNRIYNKVAEANRRLNAYCGACVLELMTDCGHIYRREKAARCAALSEKTIKTTKTTGKPAKTKSAGHSVKTTTQSEK